jgi:3-oxoacyl-[acyl-carrier protein] reductase
LAEQFVSHGDTVAATARTRANLTSIQVQLSSASGKCELYPCDVTDAAQVQNVGSSILDKFDAIDILINSAGVTYFKDFQTTSVEEFDEVLNTNLRGLFVTAKTVLPFMLGKRKGMIMNILSYAAKATYTGSSAYSASKAGAEAMMNVLRAETRDKGIKILNVFPGAVLTPIWHPKHQERYGHQMMRAEEIAKVLYEISCQPTSMIVEDIVIRPQIGDLKV